MTRILIAASVALFGFGVLAAGPITTTELAKEFAAGSRTNSVTRLCLDREPGSATITGGASSVVTIVLKDGGTGVLPLESKSVTLSGADRTAAAALMDAQTPAK